jgi:hypothetical protein
MSDPCAMLPGMRACDCGYVLVASDEPEPMGDTLIHYAPPLFEAVQGDLTFDEFKAAFEFAAFLWNLAAPEDIQKAVKHLENEMPPRLRMDGFRARALVRRMLTRRKVDFGADPRLALDVNVHRRGSRIRVKALGVRFEPGPAREGPHADHAEPDEPKRPRLLH